MSYTSGFFDAVDQGGGDYDRVYSASSFAHYFSLLVKMVFSLTHLRVCR